MGKVCTFGRVIQKKRRQSELYFISAGGKGAENVFSIEWIIKKRLGRNGSEGKNARGGKNHAETLSKEKKISKEKDTLI